MSIEWPLFDVRDNLEKSLTDWCTDVAMSTGSPMVFGHICLGNLSEDGSDAGGGARLTRIVRRDKTDKVVHSPELEQLFRSHINRFGRSATVLDWLTRWFYGQAEKMVGKDGRTAFQFIRAPKHDGRPVAIVGDSLQLHPDFIDVLLPQELVQDYLEEAEKLRPGAPDLAPDPMDYRVKQLIGARYCGQEWITQEGSNVADLLSVYQGGAKDAESFQLWTFLGAIQTAFLLIKAARLDDAPGFVSAGGVFEIAGEKTSNCPLLVLSTVVPSANAVDLAKVLAEAKKGFRAEQWRDLFGAKNAANKPPTSHERYPKCPRLSLKKLFNAITEVRKGGNDSWFSEWETGLVKWLACSIEHLRGTKHEGKPLPFTLIAGDWSAIADSGLFEILRLDFNDDPTFTADSFKNVEAFAAELAQPAGDVSAFLSSILSKEFQKAVATGQGGATVGDDLQGLLIRDLNVIIRDVAQFPAQPFAGVDLRQETKHLLRQNLDGWNLIRLKRLMLEDAFPLEMSRMDSCLFNFDMADASTAGMDFLRTLEREIGRKNYSWFIDGKYALLWDVTWPAKHPRALIRIKDSSWEVALSSLRSGRVFQATKIARWIAFLSSDGAGGLLHNGRNVAIFRRDKPWVWQSPSFERDLESYIADALTRAQFPDGLKNGVLELLTRTLITLSDDPHAGALLVILQPGHEDAFESMGTPWKTVQSGDFLSMGSDELAALMAMDGATCLYCEGEKARVSFRSLISVPAEPARELAKSARDELDGEGSRKWSSANAARRAEVALVLSVSQDGPIHIYGPEMENGKEVVGVKKLRPS